MTRILLVLLIVPPLMGGEPLSDVDVTLEQITGSVV